MKAIAKTCFRLMTWGLLAATVVLAGCNSTARSSRDPILVGPVGPSSTIGQTGKTQNPSELVNANIFLDVAIPSFDPGFPLDGYGEIDGDELVEEGIWPQLRRTEAKLFAAEMKAAMDDEKVFGSVSVTPDASTPSDLFVLGRINHSDSEVVNIGITVVDSSGEILGSKTFEYTVSAGFMRDQRNKDRNPYEPVFTQASDYVVELLGKLSQEDKEAIKDMSLMRYARYYSPENFDQYISTELKRKGGNRYYKFELKALPDENDPMIQRIKDLRAQELLFIDRLQDNYEVFEAKTRDAYSTWQSETLPEILAEREANFERNAKTALGIGAAILAVLLLKKGMESNRPSPEYDIGAVAAGAMSVWSINEAFKNNARMKVHSAVIEEQGQAMDLSVSPTVIQFEDQTIELKGTAEEQYLQWKTHLRRLFEEEATPDVQL